MINGFINQQKHHLTFFSKLLTQPLLARLALLLFALTQLVFMQPAWANSSNESSLPMSQFNFQGYVPDSKQSRKKDEDPNLIRIHVDPQLYWVLNQVIDSYQTQHQSPFRIHQGQDEDHANLLADGYVFDLIISAEMPYLESLHRKRVTSEIQVLALGRLGLWAPKETVRSTSVVTLQTGTVGLMPENSVYYRAAMEVLERHELNIKVKKRLKPVTVFQDLYTLIEQKEIPLGFLPWNRLVQAGIEQRREVLKLNNDHHGAIVHGIAMTKQGSSRNDVKEFWRYLHGPKGKAIFKAAGFD